MPAPELSKPALRSTMERRLATLAPAAAARAAARVADRVLALAEIGAADVVFCCRSFGHELDTRRLIERLLAAGHQVCIPRCVDPGRGLSLHLYPCPLETLGFGLEQPAAGTAAIDPAAVDIALIVGLAFDLRGYRLGHGGGYFDRFLAAHALATVGLAYDFQVIDRLPADPHDVPLDRLVTERRSLVAERAGS